jgi:hypothetical protein
MRETQSCAPLVCQPDDVEPVWRNLAARSARLGWPVPKQPALTGEPDLHLVISGRRSRPLNVDQRRYAFVIPRDADTVSLMSRSARPCDVSPWIEDRRCLGVMVRRMSLRGAAPGDAVDIPLDAPMLSRGWWAVEWQQEGPCRWTDGAAVLAVPRSGVLEVELAATTRYVVAPAEAPASDRMPLARIA